MRTKKLIALHRFTLWLGGATLLIFALTGISHPIMSWTGPQAVTQRPPALEADPDRLQAAVEVLAEASSRTAALVQLVPYRDRTLLQLTHAMTDPREYLSLDGTGAIDDEQMARWLASWYSGHNEADIRTTHFQNHFDSAYPSVNRLLPVYQVEFEDGLSLYVHTESLSLGGITNRYHTRLQAVFRHLHAWQWLDGTPRLKAVIMTLLLGSALVLALTGLWLLIRLPFKSKRKGLRRWHYALSWVLVIPVLLYLMTGIYHFGYKYFQPDSEGLTLPQAQTLPEYLQLPRALMSEETLSVNSAALVQGEPGDWYWRLSLHNPDQAADRHSRFAGQARESGAEFIPLSASAVPMTDSAYGRLLAQRFTGVESSELGDQTQVRHFGPDYDFRNKRLPVWQIDIPGGRVFVDTASGQLIERQAHSTRWERYSFSLVHKWGLLRPLLGPDGRDILVVVVMLWVVVLGALGFGLRWQRRR